MADTNEKSVIVNEEKRMVTVEEKRMIKEIYSQSLLGNPLMASISVRVSLDTYESLCKLESLFDSVGILTTLRIATKAFVTFPSIVTFHIQNILYGNWWSLTHPVFPDGEVDEDGTPKSMQDMIFVLRRYRTAQLASARDDILRDVFDGKTYVFDWSTMPWHTIAAVREIEDVFRERGYRMRKQDIKTMDSSSVHNLLDDAWGPTAWHIYVASFTLEKIVAPPSLDS